MSITKHGKRTEYDYHQSGYIKSVSYPDGLKQEFEYTAEGYLRSRTTIEDGKSLGQMEYTYDGNAKVTRQINPGDKSITSTFNELGNLAASHKKGTLKETFVNTLKTRSIYEGDSVRL